MQRRSIDACDMYSRNPMWKCLNVGVSLVRFYNCNHNMNRLVINFNLYWSVYILKGWGGAKYKRNRNKYEKKNIKFVLPKNSKIFFDSVGISRYLE